MGHTYIVFFIVNKIVEHYNYLFEYSLTEDNNYYIDVKNNILSGIEYRASSKGHHVIVNRIRALMDS